MYFRFGFRTNDFRVIKTARLSISLFVRSAFSLPFFFFLARVSSISIENSIDHVIPRVISAELKRDVLEGEVEAELVSAVADSWSDAIARPLISLSLSLSFVYSPFSRSSLVPKLFSAGEKLKLARLPSTDDIEAPFQVSWCTGGETLARAPTKIILDLS